MRYTLIIVLILALAGCSKPRGGADKRVSYEAASKGRIFVDPGHGGEDFGTHTLGKNKLHEKNLALTTSFLLRKQLRARGYEVIMSREDDRFIPLMERVAMAHERKAELFVSVHYNSAANRKAHGVEIFYYPSKKQAWRAKASKAAAQSVLGQLLAYTEQNSRGVKTGSFAVIRETNIPSILVEGGFLTNRAEARRIAEPEFMNQLAAGIAHGIDRYMQER